MKNFESWFVLTFHCEICTFELVISRMSFDLLLDAQPKSRKAFLSNAKSDGQARRDRRLRPIIFFFVVLLAMKTGL